MEISQQNELATMLDDLIECRYGERLWNDCGWEHDTDYSGCIVTKGAMQLVLEERVSMWHRDRNVKVYGFIPEKTLLFYSSRELHEERKTNTAKDGYWVNWLLMQLDKVNARRLKLRAIRERLGKIELAEKTMPVDDELFFKDKK